MTLRALLFFAGFLVAAIGSLFAPVLGVLGYTAHYAIGAEGQWWFSSLRIFEVRYALTLALVTAVGFLMNSRKQSWGPHFFSGQEKLMLAFLGLVWLTVLAGPATQGLYTVVDHPSTKLTKILFFVMLMSHIVTTLRNLDLLIWGLIAGGLVLGLEAYETPREAFSSGRLETVGGPDFRDSNALAAYLAALLPLVGIQFLRSGWRGKLVCAACGAFILNGVVLARSRGAVVGLVAGAVVAVLFCPKAHRGKMALGMTLGVASLFYLGDTGFWERAGTITKGPEGRDRSAESRLEIWEGGIKMATENPFGVGAGNFAQNIGKYAPLHPNRDAHSTFVRCLCELGIAGLVVLAALIVNSLVLLFKSVRRSNELIEQGHPESGYLGLGILSALTVFVTSGLMGTFTYVEAFWWYLAIPVCLHRALENAVHDNGPAS
jgi:O-antigen ligase